MEVLIPNSFKATRSPFSDMLLSPRQALRASRMFESVLRKSFEEDEREMGIEFRRRIQTGSEMRRRAEIMARWFRVFRGDLGYSLAKIEAEIGSALRSELDGGIYSPAPAGRSYCAPEGERQ